MNDKGDKNKSISQWEKDIIDERLDFIKAHPEQLFRWKRLLRNWIEMMNNCFQTYYYYVQFI